MDPETQTQTGETPSSVAIEPPQHTGPVEGEANLDQLRQLQQANYGKDKKKEAAEHVVVPIEVKDIPEETPPASETKEEKKEDRAEQIFRKNQETTAKLNGQAKEEISDDSEDPDGFKPIATLRNLNEPEKKKPETSSPETKTDLDPNKETNLQNLRKIAGEFKNERNTLQSRVAELESQLAQKTAPAVLERENVTLKQRVEQLEQYEQLFALHDNPEFKQKYIDSANSVLSEMKEIAEDYGADETVVDQILSAKTRRELDEVLTENFASASPQNDLKTLRQKYVGIYKERQKEESKPKETLEQYRARKEQGEVERNRDRDQYTQQVIKEGWQLAMQSVQELPEEEKIYELIEVPGKKEHNEQVVRPTLNHANQLLSHALGHVEFLIRNQGKPSRGFVAWLGTLFQQASAAQMLRATRQDLYNRYSTLQKESEKQHNYDRPNLNGSPNKSPQPRDPNKKMSTEEKLGSLFIDVVSREESA